MAKEKGRLDLPRHGAAALALAAAISLALSGCGDSTAGGGGSASASPATDATLRIGTGLTPETRHAAYIYQAALQEAGYTVDVVETEDDRPAYFASMGLDTAATSTARPTASSPAEGLVHITPDLSGDLLLYLTDNGAVSPTIIEEERARAAEPSPTVESSPAVDSQPSMASGGSASADPSGSAGPSTSPTPSPSATSLNVRGLSSNDIVSYVDRALPDTAEVLSPSNATNRYGYVVTRATAQRYDLESMSDLGTVCAELSLVAPSSYDANPSGASSLLTHYGCTPGTRTTSNNRSDQAQELITGATSMSYMYSASAEISANNLLLLDDPERTELAQNIVPITRAGELPQEVKDILNDVSAHLDTDSLVRLNTLTSGDNPVSETDAAYFWLTTMKE
ncbi:MAG: glycine betaine ABC transporter substrate-binding protein [Rothia sp. (in: high G+C Gram-positive bacteria)]|nr:glycine betaine ABC transporter substrate-binding protein [Rothia sp. (in: high G+C Gram-positive bacteria)]